MCYSCTKSSPILLLKSQGFPIWIRQIGKPWFFLYCVASNAPYPKKCRFLSLVPSVFPYWSAVWRCQHIPLQQTDLPASAGKRPCSPHSGSGGRGLSPAEGQLHQWPPHWKPRPALCGRGPPHQPAQRWFLRSQSRAFQHMLPNLPVEPPAHGRQGTQLCNKSRSFYVPFWCSPSKSSIIFLYSSW